VGNPIPDFIPHNYNAIRRAAEVHRQVRQYARAHIKPGMQMTDIAVGNPIPDFIPFSSTSARVPFSIMSAMSVICIPGLMIADMIENGTRALVEENGMKSGIGFPTGLSRNHCAAHWTRCTSAARRIAL
jgi:methionyl aminopeptidase